MARRGRRGRPVHGWLIVDKAPGATSTQTVARARRLFGAAKAGHAGALDPLAGGVLPVAFGEATKTVPHVVAGTKTYAFTARWGEGRSTDDADGEVVETSDVRPAAEAVEAALPAFIGDIMQTPPAFSAVKVGGRRAYSVARECGTVDLAARPARIDSFRMVRAPDADHAEFSMRCGKGVYVRSAARDLARALGTCGHVVALRRERVGPFGLDRAISLADLEALGDSAREERLLPVADGLAGLPALAVDAGQADRLKRGQRVPLVRAPVADDGAPIGEGALWTRFAGRPVALAELRLGEVRPVRVFNF